MVNMYIVRRKSGSGKVSMVGNAIRLTDFSQ